MNSNQEQYIEFGIGKEKYAIKISEIHEIIKVMKITEIPNVMSYVKGVINLRGKIVPVINLRNLFGMESSDYTKSTRIVVVNHKDETVGIIVDQVEKVTTFSEIQPSPERVSGVNGANFSGMGILDAGGIVGILELDKVLIKEGETIEQS